MSGKALETNTGKPCAGHEGKANVCQYYLDIGFPCGKKLKVGEQDLCEYHSKIAAEKRQRHESQSQHAPKLDVQLPGGKQQQQQQERRYRYGYGPESINTMSGTPRRKDSRIKPSSVNGAATQAEQDCLSYTNRQYGFGRDMGAQDRDCKCHYGLSRRC